LQQKQKKAHHIDLKKTGVAEAYAVLDVDKTILMTKKPKEFQNWLIGEKL
jgi:hypothetical protein